MDKSTCNGPQCTRVVLCRGLCKSHYEQLRQHGEMWEIGTRRKSFEQRFWEKVDKSGSCWVWTAGCNRKGYGQFKVSKRKATGAHRVSWELTNGPAPEGAFIDHICHNPRCVRPDHLRLATPKQNSQYRSGPNANNKSTGTRGVYKEGGKYRVMVSHAGSLHHCGTFATLEEAQQVAIRERARLYDFPEFGI